jgi:hypothetical protein
MTGGRGLKARLPLGGGIGGRPPTGRQVCNLVCKCGIVLRLLLLLWLVAYTVGRRVPACVLPVWGRRPLLFLFLSRMVRSSC